MFRLRAIALLLVTFAISSKCVLLEKPENVTEFLNRRMKESKEEIAKAYMEGNRESVMTLSYDIDFEKVWSENLRSDGALTVQMFNKMFILEGNRVMSVALDPASNNRSSWLRQVAQIRPEQPIKFVKSIVWKSNLYLLVCHDDASAACTLYKGTNDFHLGHRQIIKHKGRPTDAAFFTKKNRLYLVVAHNSDPFPVPSILYRWTGTFMDIIDEIPTIGAVAVTTFNYKTWSIIVFGQNEKAQPDVGSKIYKFKDSGVPPEIHYLPTNGPISMHNYYHDGRIFVLIINEFTASNVYWWDGDEFLHMLDLVDVVAPRMVNIAHLNDETLFFVSNENYVNLYKVTSTKYAHLRLLRLENCERVVDMGVWIDQKTTLTLLLVTVDAAGLYRIEPWELRIKKIHKKAGISEALGATEECLTELRTRLNDRAETIENVARQTWPTLLSSIKNVNSRAIGTRVEKLILHSASVGQLDVLTRDEILLASEIKNLAESAEAPGSRIAVNSVLEASRKTVRVDEDNHIFGDVIIENNAIFEQLHTDNINTEFLNDAPVLLDVSVISATRNQSFLNAQLRGKNITVRNLEVDQICGIPKNYWLKEKNSNEIFVKGNEVKIINDSVFVRTDQLSFENLELKTVEEVNLDYFLKNVFLRGERQIIKGNIIKESSGALNINNLVVEELNGISKSDFVTREGKQRLENLVFVKTMSTENLVVEKINGIAVAECAMVSKKNHVKGQVTVAVIRVLNEFAVENVTRSPEVRPVQVYDQVTLIGRIKAKRLRLEPNTFVALSGRNNSALAEETNIPLVLQSYWTKSTPQIIENPVNFEAGLSVDELSIKYLNGINIDEDVLLTSAKEIIQEQGSLEFQNFIATGSILEDATDFRPEAVADSSLNSEFSANSNTLYDIVNNTIYFNQEFRIERLGVERLMIENYNGIPIDEITRRIYAQDLEPYEYPDSVLRFDSITVNNRMKTDSLDLRFVNGADERSLESLLHTDADYKVEVLKSDELNFSGDVKFLDATANRIQKFINSWATQQSSNETFALTIDGELLVAENLQVVEINDRSAESYLDTLSRQDLEINSQDQLIIDDLTVQHDFEIKFLNGSKIETLVEKTFSKSRAQNLTDSKLSFFKVSVDNLRTEKINQVETRNLVYTDSEELNFGGNLTFTKLIVSVDEDIQTRYLNGYELYEIYDKLSTISPRAINNLTVIGNIFWGPGRLSAKPSQTQIGPLEKIVTNGLVIGSEASPLQEINGEIRIDSSTEMSPGVFVRRMRYRSDYSEQQNSTSDQLNGVDLGKIIRQSVLDDWRTDSVIKIESQTIFRGDLTTSRLNVPGEIGIGALNVWRVDDLHSSIVGINSLNSADEQAATSRFSNGRTYRQDNRLGKTMIFSGDVKVQKLIIRSDKTGSASNEPRIHGVPIAAIFFSDTSEKLPNNTYFEHLQVSNNAWVKSLDSVDFDDFVENRVTLSTDQEVRGNFRFNGRIQVSESASVDTINGIDPFDLVINYSNETQIITGEKIFEGDINIYGKTYAPLIAGLNLKNEYDNALLNYENVDIFGDIIFEADVDRSSEPETRWQLGPSSFVNDLQLKNLKKNRDASEENFLRALMRNETRLEERLARASNATSNLPEIFSYFESEENLRINVAKVDRVEYLRVEELTILNMYADQLGRFCGLADDCPCRKQYVAEISSSQCEIRQVEAPRRIIYNFHPTSGAFGVTVTTRSVSSSKRCTNVESLSTEFTTISWMKNLAAASTPEEEILGINFTRGEIEIPGYLSDVKVFTQNDLIFIALAIYYDPINQSHKTNSLIYALDLATDVLTLVKSIPTSYAVGVQVFKIPNKGAHILFSSIAPSEADSAKLAESLLYRFEPKTAKFQLLRSFATGGNRHAASVAQAKDQFLLLDDVALNSINVYNYDEKSDNFCHYQSLYQDSTAPIRSIETFYAGEFRQSQVFVIITTEHDQFFVYEYMFIGSFQLIAQKRVNGILAMVPFDVSNRRYMFVGTETNSTVLRIVQQGRN